MRRKLIQHGLSSLTVSLPKKWVVKRGLKKGDEVELTERRGELVVSSQPHREAKRIELDVSNAHPMIRRIIGAAFKSGYDDVVIRFNSYEELKAVQELMRDHFTGFEIVGQTKNSVRIKNLGQVTFAEFDTVLKRFFFVLNQMASDTQNAVDADDFAWLKRITLCKIESDKTADYCRRAINQEHVVDGLRPAPLYTLVEQLEKIADRYTDLCEYIAEKKLKLSPRAKSLLHDLVAFQRNFYDLFYGFEVRKIIAFGKKKIQLQKKLDRLSPRGAESKSIQLFDRILNILFDLNGPLLASRI